MLKIKKNRRSYLKNCFAMAAAAAYLPAYSQIRPFPTKNVTLVVPFAPGGNVDIVARTLAVPFNRYAGQSVIVDNRAGGGGSVGTGWVARAEPDGHTLLVATPGQLGTLPEMIKTPYRADSLVPIAVLSRTPVVVVVRSNDNRFKTPADFLKLMRTKEEGVTIGHAGPGSPNHLAVLQLEDAVKARVNAVPYKGSGPALVDLIGGQIDAVVDQITSSTPHIKGGALRALMVLGPPAPAILANTPTMGQLGLPAFDGTTYVGLFAPKGTPGSAINTIFDLASKSVAEPSFTNVIRELGSDLSLENSASLARLVSEDSALASRLIKQGRLKAE